MTVILPVAIVCRRRRVSRPTCYLMSYEVGKQALDFLIANSGNRRNLEVDFLRRRAFDELGCG